MIAKYIINRYIGQASLYGFGHKNIIPDKRITKSYFDIQNYNNLEENLNTIKPDILIHLAGISSAQVAFESPLQCIHINGLVTAYICDIIHKNKLNTTLFNACSSEIYKGHIDYTVKENDNNMFNIHPYSIAKIMGRSIVEFYRNTYGYNFSNGILFTVESKYKGDAFLLNKVAKHAKKWKNDNIPLTVGSLSSFRDIIHAHDVASAVHVITNQSFGNDYLICSGNSNKILDLVLKIYTANSIELYEKDNIYYDKIMHKEVLIIEKKNNGLDTTPIDIRGNAENLKKLGWVPEYSIDNIIHEIIH